MTAPTTATEFDLIRRHFAPLAAGHPAGLGLTDDAAVLDPPAGRQIVLTTDTVVEGIHFPAGEAPDAIGRRLLRVNLSDLAAMGARPEGYLLNTAWPRDAAEAWIAAFAEGLRQDQERYGLHLFGGDTVATPGPLTLTLTAIGSVPDGRALTRAGARAGDLVFVTGAIGDGAFGLMAAQGAPLPGLDAAARARLASRFRLPEPRLAVGQGLAGKDGPPLATAAADVSDGLVADLDHICEASGVSAVIAAARVPLSPEGSALAAAEPGLLLAAVAGGDDYELVFTAPAARAPALATLARECGVAITAIGEIGEGAGCRLVDAAGGEIALPRGGFRHF